MEEETTSRSKTKKLPSVVKRTVLRLANNVKSRYPQVKESCKNDENIASEMNMTKQFILKYKTLDIDDADNADNAILMNDRPIVFTDTTDILYNYANHKTNDYLTKNGVHIDFENLSNEWITNQMKYIESLSPRDIYTIRQYTYNGDRIVNEYLRNNFNEDIFKENIYHNIRVLAYQLYECIINTNNTNDYIKTTNKNEFKNVEKIITPIQKNPLSFTRLIKLGVLFKNGLLNMNIFYKAIEQFKDDIQRIILGAPPLPTELTVFRGVETKFYQQDSINTFYLNKGFISTTIDPKIIIEKEFMKLNNNLSYNYYCCLQKLKLVAETRAIIMFPISRVLNEYEILLPLDTIYELHNGTSKMYIQQKPTDTCLQDGNVFVTNITVTNTNPSLLQYLKQQIQEKNDESS